MHSIDFAPIIIARYQLRLRACEETSLPKFLGSTLRGAFGHALKQAVCIMPHRDCERCLVADRCIYPYLFETPPPPDVKQLRGQQNAPHPFILTPLERRKKPVEAIKSPIPDVKTHPAHQSPTATGAAVKLVKRAPQQETASAEERVFFASGNELPFELILMGQAIEFLPYVIYAVSEMARQGLGADRARFELEETFAFDDRGAKTSIYTNKTGRISAGVGSGNHLDDLIKLRLDRLREQGVLEALNNQAPLKLKFLTPTRIRVADDLQAEMSFEMLVRNLLRRVSLLAAVHGKAELQLDYRGLIALAASVKMQSAQLRWNDWERYSNRQRTKMHLGGFIGEIAYSGEALKDFLPLLIAGEFLHIGSGTAFGLGKFEIVK